MIVILSLLGMKFIEKNDILMILGKGHGGYQIIGTEKDSFFLIKKKVEKYIKGIR